MPDEFSTTRRRLLTGGLVTVILVVAGLAWTVWRVVQKHSAANAWVEHTHGVVAQLDGLLSQVQATEASQRGFLMTGEPGYLELYQQWAKQVDRTLDAIADLTQDNPNQQQRTTRLRNICRDKTSEMNEAIRQRRESGVDSVMRATTLSDRGKQAMELFRITLANMRAEEERLLGIRRATDEGVSALLVQIMVGLSILAAVLALVMIWLLRWITRLQAGLVTICAWTRQVQHGGEWMPVETYLHRRFGIKITHGISEEAAKKMLADVPLRDAAGVMRSATSTHISRPGRLNRE